MKQNALKLYKHYKEMIENPKGADAAEKTLVKNNAIKAKADMESHFETAPKYRNDPEIQEILKALKGKETKSKGKK